MGCSCGKETLNINGTRYAVCSRLGEGAFSYVDLVEDNSSGKHRLFAVKRVRVQSVDDEERVLTEVENYARVDHPNVIKLVASGWKERRTVSNQVIDPDGEFLILLPYYQETLQNEIERRSATKRRFTESIVLSIFQNICNGVAAMHNAKPEPLAHRDIKPGNVMLTGSDGFFPILMDLGSAGPTRIQVSTRSEAKAVEDFAEKHCSMLYRPPEFFHVDSHAIIDERTDVWSLGCLLFAMCFFKSPFEEAYERGDSVALAVNSGHVNIPENSKYSQGLRDLILNMLIVDSTKRPFLDVVLRRIDDLHDEVTIVNKTQPCCNLPKS